VRALNPHVDAISLHHRIGAKEADGLVQRQHVVIDGTDNFATRLAVADACLRHRVPLVSAAVGAFEGQLGVFRGWEADKPCYRCFVGHDPDREGVTCAEQGVLGALTGVMGSLAALEAIRAIVPSARTAPASCCWSTRSACASARSRCPRIRAARPAQPEPGRAPQPRAPSMNARTAGPMSSRPSAMAMFAWMNPALSPQS
jgi:molybdopterin/thiamine biosynthesis adenylyltransferase